MEPSSLSKAEEQKLALKRIEAIAELEMQITQQQLNVRSGEFRKRQIESELHTVATNRAAAEETIARLTDELGKLTEQGE